MATRRKATRKQYSQKIFAAIDRDTKEAKMASEIRTGLTIDAEAAAKALAEGKDPFGRGLG